MKELASILFHSQTQAHVFHLRVKGVGAYATHKALQKYYETIDGLTDSLVESYQGNHDLVYFDTVDELDNNATLENIISYFEKLAKVIEKLRTNKELQDSWIQNDIDTIVSLLMSTLYKLKNLK
jgi:DNA-binding ferritin-like protein